jgi:hypothetical protein
MLSSVHPRCNVLYGGAVITNAAARASNVVGLVYVAALRWRVSIYLVHLSRWRNRP